MTLFVVRSGYSASFRLEFFGQVSLIWFPYINQLSSNSGIFPPISELHSFFEAVSLRYNQLARMGRRLIFSLFGLRSCVPILESWGPLPFSETMRPRVSMFTARQPSLSSGF